MAGEQETYLYISMYSMAARRYHIVAKIERRLKRFSIEMDPNPIIVLNHF
jgi:hypothetical protein